MLRDRSPWLCLVTGRVRWGRGKEKENRKWKKKKLFENTLCSSRAKNLTVMTYSVA
jgi:hypothetical protein